MIDNEVHTAAHLSRLATWLMATLGKAVGISVAVAAAIGILGAAAGVPAITVSSAFFGPIAFAAVLWNATAPRPPAD